MNVTGSCHRTTRFDDEAGEKEEEDTNRTDDVVVVVVVGSTNKGSINNMVGDMDDATTSPSSCLLFVRKS